MDPFTLIEQYWWIGIPVALMFGAVLAINPLALPVLATALGIGTAGSVAERNRAVPLTAAFGAGMVVVYTALGILAGSIDEIVTSIFTPWAGWGYLVLGAILAAFGLVLLFKPAAFCLACAKPAKRSPTMAGAFLAGLPAGFVNCPACAGIVTGVAASAAALGNPVYSTTVMFSFGAGHAIALVALARLVTSRWRPSSQVLRFARPAVAILLFAGAGWFIWVALGWGLSTGPRLA